MKIIGQAVDGNFLVQANPDEMARLTGYDSNSYRKYDNKKEIVVGDEINVGLIFEHMKLVHKMADDLNRARGILETLVGGLTSAEALVKMIVTSNDKPEA